MTKTFAIAALATLISAPAFAGGVTANEWFINQLKADNNHFVAAQVQSGETVVIGSRGSAGALDVASVFAAEGDERQLVASIADGSVKGAYTTSGSASDAALEVALQAAREGNDRSLVKFLEGKLGY